MLGFIVWFTLGAFVGWIASLLLKTEDADRSTSINVAASIVGAVLGGLLARGLGYSGSRIEEVLSFQGVLFSGVGAAIVLVAANLVPLRREVTP